VAVPAAVAVGSSAHSEVAAVFGAVVATAGDRDVGEAGWGRGRCPTVRWLIWAKRDRTVQPGWL